MRDTYHELRQRLGERREELVGRVARMSADVRHTTQPLERDSEEQAIQLENDDVLDALDDAGRYELLRIERALERLEKGDYGICSRCGDPIAPARLRAMPTAEYCIRCAEELGP